MREARAGGTAPLTQGQRWWREAEGTLQQGPEGGTGTQSSDLATKSQNVPQGQTPGKLALQGAPVPVGLPRPSPRGAWNLTSEEPWATGWLPGTPVGQRGRATPPSHL